ncbi:hypothetical protein DesfrDRAFT_1366 [Solidesulfovibrio fructosivorans JJ]]|uniref:Uncharacterized protein n=1 Tax=Solidesulfovibrio fructosivorans JJ] TaxID=596151 RepID=E1JUR7_SOLFR|nr:hypothetical protein [Solidesulfovibrio fructosivorans]EFL51831.1 hypothetical protein DesfrDRAFT_1366 [Solidesulfovibrio fructosivorans JJ]]
MQGLDVGIFAQKYKFWQYEYASRNKEVVEFRTQANNRRKELTQGHGITSLEVCLFMNDSISTLVNKYGYGRESTDSTTLIEKIAKGDAIIDANAVLSTGSIEVGLTSPAIRQPYGYGELFVDITIDIAANLDLIVEDVKNFVLSMRAVAAGEISTDSGFINRHRSLAIQKIIADKKSSTSGGYTPASDRVRAVGLWLWDRSEALGGERGAIKQAIADLHKTDFLPQLGLEDTEAADLRFFRRRTDECIEARKVLPFSKPKKGTSK